MDIQLYSDFLINDAKEHGEKTAVVTSDGTYTYARLNSLANSFANGLMRLGVKPGDRIMAALPRDSSSIIAMMGIMKMGAVLVPVSTSYPQGRIDKIREDSGAVLFVGADCEDGKTAYKDVMKDTDDAEIPRPDIDTLAPCLIMYTSGSTGNPKGVVLRHFGFINSAGIPYEDNTVSFYTKKYVHAFLGITPTTFQFFYLEFCVCIANACTYVLADLEQSRNPVLMAEYMKEYGVDFITGTPSRILQYLDIPVYAEAFRKVRVLGIGGERTPAGLPEAVHKINPECHILNAYGMTESNGIVIVSEAMTADDHGFVQHGWKLLVLDEDNKETADGETGELLMAGDNMMEGYMNLPEEMAAKTVVIDGVSYFRTGDLAKRFEDGGYVIVGRLDQQIKLRGLRMEPGEIEKIIQDFEGVRIEKAVAKVNVIHNAEHLVAYYTGPEKADEAQLRKHLAFHLPQYMVPDYFMYLEKFPLNPNGKIDYRNLPEIKIEDLEIVAPADEIEHAILEKCRKIVHFDEFGVTSPLDEVGFTSLTYIELASMVFDNYHVELKLSDLMAGGATVRNLADKIKSGETISRKETGKLKKYPFAPQLYQFTCKNPVADMYRKLEFTDKWKDAGQIRETIVRVFGAYPYLFTTFAKENGVWYQIPHDDAVLKETDIPIIQGEPSQKELDEFCTPYELGSSARLFDVKIYSGKKVTVLLHIQHILMDHVFVEGLIDQIRRALSDPSFRIKERADYFEYTMEVCGNDEERPLPAFYKAVLKDSPKPVSNIEHLAMHIERGKLDPIITKYHVQAADYVLGLVSQAYLEVMGLDEAVFFDMFGGRNDARYFNTAGFFPIMMMLPVNKDAEFYKHIGKDVVEAICQLHPGDDLSYRTICKGEYPYPRLSYNCMEFIEENDDFSLTSMFSGDQHYDEMSRALLPHLDFMCLMVGTKAAVVHLNYDTGFISKETAQAILDRITMIAQRNVE